MKNIKIPDLFYYPALILVIIASFMKFSPVYFPFMDTNTAVSIIMTPGVSFPGELYLWGQNFSGTFIPFLANLLHVIYRFPPDLAVSVVTWLILACGFLSVATLMRTRFAKLMLAVIWFFPSWIFSGHLTSVFGIQISLLGIMIYLLNRFYKAYTLNASLMWLTGFCTSVIISVWVSDLAIVSILLLAGILLIQDKGSLRLRKVSLLLKQKAGYLKASLIMAFVLAGIAFIVFAKIRAQQSITYTHPLLNDPASLAENAGLILSNIFNILIFKTGNITDGIFAWAVLTALPAVFVISAPAMGLLTFIRNQRWILFFLLNAIVLLLCLILSAWVLENGASGKYFSMVFLSAWIVVLMFAESTESSRPGLRSALLAGVVAISVVSSLVPLWVPKAAKANFIAYDELKKMNAFGIIGESSLVYAIASTDPNHIKPLPHDWEPVRNAELKKTVFRQHSIYLLKENWLESFPDTIRQYGLLFQRTGTPVIKSGLEICRYQQYVKRTIFPVDSMKHQGALLKDSMAYSGKAAMITLPFDRSRHFIYGPFISLPKGKYTAVYRLKISRDLGINNFAVLNISYNYGKNVLTSRTLRMSEFARGYHFEDFDLPFETQTDLQGVEFRIMYLGETDLYFDRIVLIENQSQ